MKILVAGFCVTGLAAFAQNAPGPLSHDRLQEIAAKWKARPLLYGSPAGNSPTFKGNIITEDGTAVTSRGEAEIKTNSVIVHADTAVYHKDSGEIEATGNVRITPVASSK